jgi:hypothetical protein
MATVTANVTGSQKDACKNRKEHNKTRPVGAAIGRPVGSKTNEEEPR